MEDVDREVVAEIFACLGHEARLAILEGLRDDQPMTVIASDLEMQRGSLQDHIERVIDCGLVYRPESEGQTYALTPLGRYVLDMVDSEGETIDEVLHRHEDRAQEIRDSLEDSPLSDAERDRVSAREAWEDLRDIVDELSVE